MANDRDHYSAPAMRTLKLAAEVVGDPHILAICLGVDDAQLESWMRGEVRPPNEIFLQALDIVAAGSLGSAARRDPSARAQFHAGRLRLNAVRMQKTADRAKANADRMQASADHAQRIADLAERAAEEQTDLSELDRIAERAKSVPDPQEKVRQN